MAEISIYEERISERFLTQQQFRIKGNLQVAYTVQTETDGEDELKHNKEFLLQFLTHQNKYPLFLTFEDYDDKYTNFLRENKLEFTLNVLKKTKNKSDYYFTVKIPDADTLAFLLNETYWLASQDNFYWLSFSANLVFELVKVKEWIMVMYRPAPTFEMDSNSTIITTDHDGLGFRLLSNEEKYETLESFLKNLPKDTTITYLNGDLVDGENNILE